MRSLKECYEIAKKYHTYWAGSSGYTRFMCLAAAKAHDFGDLTEEEYRAVSKDATSLVGSFGASVYSLKMALGNPPDMEVKIYWNKYIDSLENQDG